MIGIVVQRELLAKLKDRAFIFSTVFLLVVVLLSVTVPVLLRRDNPHLAVGTVGSAAQVVAADAAQLGRRAGQDADRKPPAAGAAVTPADGATAGLSAARIEARQFPDVAAVEAALRAGTLDAALVPATGAGTGTGSDAGTGTGAALELVAEQSVPDELPPLVAAAARTRSLTTTLTGAGLDAAGAGRAVEQAVASAPAQRLLDPPKGDRHLAVGLSAIFATIFFFGVFFFGMAIAQSVVEEKQSRVVEILVAAIPVRALLTGKVVANTVLALGQVVLLVGVGIAGAGIAGQGDVVSAVLGTCGWFLLFFVLGFTMLATLWAACGALASRVEDLNATTVPMQFLVMGPFFATIWINEPGPLLRVLSYVPLTAPLSMPQRLILGDAAWWEALVAAGVVLATAALMIRVAARVYRQNLLRTAGRTPWREALGA